MDRDKKRFEKQKPKHLKASEKEKGPGREEKDRDALDMLSSFKERKNLEDWNSEVTAAVRNKGWFSQHWQKIRRFF